MNLYEVLGLNREPTPSPDDVKRAYRNKAKKAHPDHGGSKEKFAALVTARDVLSDANRRAKYDNTGEIDDKKVDNVENHALIKAMAAIDFVLNTCKQRNINVDQVDVIADAVTAIKRDLSELDRQERQFLGEAARFRRLAKKFSRKCNGPNRVSPMLEARAIDNERAAIALKEPIACFKRAIEILQDHKFDYTPVSMVSYG